MADAAPDDAAVEQTLADLDELLGRLEQLPGPAGELALEAVSVRQHGLLPPAPRIVVPRELAQDLLQLRQIGLLVGVDPGEPQVRVRPLGRQLRRLFELVDGVLKLLLRLLALSLGAQALGVDAVEMALGVEHLGPRRLVAVVDVHRFLQPVVRLLPAGLGGRRRVAPVGSQNAVRRFDQRLLEILAHVREPRAREAERRDAVIARPQGVEVGRGFGREVVADAARLAAHPHLRGEADHRDQQDDGELNRPARHLRRRRSRRRLK